MSFSVPVNNSFEVLQIEDAFKAEDLTEVICDETKDDLLQKQECFIREKVKVAVKRKIESKLKGFEVSMSTLKNLKKNSLQTWKKLYKKSLPHLETILRRKKSLPTMHMKPNISTGVVKTVMR